MVVFEGGLFAHIFNHTYGLENVECHVFVETEFQGFVGFGEHCLGEVLLGRLLMGACFDELREFLKHEVIYSQSLSEVGK